MTETGKNLGAFCDWAEVRLPGRASGPLAGLRFAVKDLYDVEGHVTGCGNPDWLATHGPAASTAPAVERLVEAGATMIGKTITDELAFSLFGENFHYGTPVNARAPDRVPGGSSSGSAAAVAGGLVDFAVGSDTGGSVRVPAGFCGILGIRPTHGRISLEGCMPLAPSLDTVGWFANDPELLERVGRVLIDEPTGSKRPGGLLIAEDAFDLLEPSSRDPVSRALEDLKRTLGAPEPVALAADLEDWRPAFLAVNGPEIWGAHGDWITKTKPRFGPLIQGRFEVVSQATAEQAAQGRETRARAAAKMAELLDGDKVLILPTTPGPAPFLKTPPEDVESFRQRILGLTCVAGLARLPQVNLPLAAAEGAPVGISILAASGGDMMLLGLGREIMRAAVRSANDRRPAGR